MSFRTFLKEKLSFLIPYDTPEYGTPFEWNKWEKETQAKYPISYAIFDQIPSWAARTWYVYIQGRYKNLVSKYFHKHHHIKIDVDRFMSYPLKPKSNLSLYHWYDTDTKILYANFQLLVDYVEKEKPEENTDWTTRPSDQEIWSEIQTLYNWWTTVRPKKWIENESSSMEEYGIDISDIGSPTKSANYKKWADAFDKHDQIERQLEDEDTEMLVRLMIIRKSLWT